MKYSKLKMLMAVALILGGAVSSQAIGPEDGKILRTQIISHIENPDLRYTDIQKESATVHIQVNAKSEMVVVQVDSESQFVDEYLKAKLNYKKVTGNVGMGRYVIKITMQDGSLAKR
ncbi:MAG: hypothetical protein KTR24_01930 [Saprospiraceae bacterium]|nr:hypothetical protein [Saprospiraceae bacterium]